MKFLKHSRIVPFFILTLLISCAGEQESEQQVDQNYLDSQSYSDFDEDAAREGEIRAKNNASMEVRLQQLAECEDITSKMIPFEIDDQEISALSESEPDNCTIENDQQSLRLLGESQFREQTIRWILLERQTAYRDQELLITTFRENNLQSFNTVGVFKKNPSEEILTEIQVRNKDNNVHVSSRTIRNIFYPIEQENTITTDYIIDTDGSIREL